MTGIIPATVDVQFTAPNGSYSGTDASYWSDPNGQTDYFSMNNGTEFVARAMFYFRREEAITEDFFMSAPWLAIRARRNAGTPYARVTIGADGTSPPAAFVNAPTSGVLGTAFDMYRVAFGAEYSGTDSSRAWAKYSSVAVGQITPLFLMLEFLGAEYSGGDVAYIAWHDAYPEFADAYVRDSELSDGWTSLGSPLVANSELIRVDDTFYLADDTALEALRTHEVYVRDSASPDGWQLVTYLRLDT